MDLFDIFTKFGISLYLLFFANLLCNLLLLAVAFYVAII